MNPEEYAAAQAYLASGVAAYVQRYAQFFAGPLLTPRQWLDFLKMIFPEVQRRYAEAASLGRYFYDSERKKHHPDLVRNDRFLSEIEFDWFVKSMEPARKGLSQADSRPQDVAKVALTAVREIGMAGRRQIIGAVSNDPETQVLQGWARVATGRETCAWCLMLISRGAEFPSGQDTPWYHEAATAGINLDDQTVIDLWKESGWNPKKFRKATKGYIEEWHTGCDCLAVPVFDVNNWPGRDSAQRAMQLWIDAGKEADELIAAGKARTNSNYTETLNALRRRLSRGDISMSNYALAA